MLIKNGLCALPGNNRLERRDIRIAAGKISAIGQDLAADVDEQVLDASGLEVFPGAIDPHVHFNEPGFTHREDFLHGSMAAARGGVTTVVDMPCTSLPPVTSAANLAAKLAAMGQHSVVDYALFGGVSGHILEESLAKGMAELAADVVGFKCYTISGMETFTAVDHDGLGRALRKAAELGRPLLLHAEDPSIIKAATERYKAAAVREQRAAVWDDYVESRPAAAEYAAVASALSLTKAGARVGDTLQADVSQWLHIVHVGTADAAEFLARESAGASCETCPHYLIFSREAFAEKGSALKTAPPVKEAGNAERLWAMLADGRIAFVTSDHAPAPASEKHSGSIWTDYGGIPGTGTLFPILYSEGYRKGRLDLRAFVRATSGAAAERYCLSGGKGSIEVGKDADLVLVDPKSNWTVRGTELLSKGTITPFEGMRLDGAVFKTLVRGKVVWDGSLVAVAAGAAVSDDAASGAAALRGISVSAGWGKHIRWGYK
jgi:allantoinase